MAHILKSDQVQMESSYKLDTSTTKNNQNSSACQVIAPDAVRILESSDQSTLIEVICSCGQKTYVRCDH